MEMKTLTLNGQTFGVNDPNAVQTEAQNLTPEEQEQARKNIGAMKCPEDNDVLNLKGSEVKDISSIEINYRTEGEVTGSTTISAYKDTEDENGARYSIVEFSQTENGNSTVLRNIHDGINDWDAATVRQLKGAVAGLETTKKRITVIDETSDDDHYPTAKAVYDYIGNVNHVKYINNQDKDNRISIRSLESGIYIIQGYFVWHDGSNNVNFKSEQHVIINRTDEKTEMQMFYPVNNQVVHLRITDTSFERTDVELNKVGTNDGAVHEIPTVTHKIGENLLTDDIVTLGAGWTGNMTDGFTHTAGNTEPLTFDINSADGDRYLIFATFGNTAESAIHLTIGDSYPSDPYGNNPFIWGVQSVGGGSFSITPITSGWTGTINNLACHKIIEDGEYTYTASVILDGLAHDDMPNHLAGFWNIQMGVNALKGSINTTRCIAIGKDSLGSLKSGGRNIGLGTYSLPYMEYGENNISIGADSGFSVIEAHDCVIIGKAAMQRGKKVKYNIAIGPSALYGDGKKDETESEGNVGIGKQAGYYCSGKSNVYIGPQAGYYHQGNTSVYIGSSAGRTNTTGYNNVAIGPNADCSNAGASNWVAVGAGAKANKSNQAVFGGDHITETLLKGDLIVRGADGVKRQIVFNEDGTIGWVTAE